MRRLAPLFAAMLCVIALLVPSVGFAEEDSAADTQAVEATEEASTDEAASASEGEASDESATEDSSDEDDSYIPRTVVTETTLAEDGSTPALNEARAACVIDDCGNVLYELNGEMELDMASITKVMTAMVALDSGISLDKTFPFVVDSFSEDAQLAGYVDGQEVSLGELLKVSLIFSGNDTATNVAYAVSGSVADFAELMNKKAAEIGMEHTHFTNPHGLKEDGHYSCALDLAKMGRYALEHYPFIRETVKTRSIQVVMGEADITLYSTDELMEVYEGLRGIKTGKEATGSSFLGSARRNLVTLYSCVLCCDTDEGRFDDSAIALDWGFSQYDTRTLSHADWTLRAATWQDGFWLKCPITPTRSVTGSDYRGRSVDYKTVALKPNALVGSDSTCGSTVWSQEGRTLGSTSYRSGQLTNQLPAWNAFALPLFES